MLHTITPWYMYHLCLHVDIQYTLEFCFTLKKGVVLGVGLKFFNEAICFLQGNHASYNAFEHDIAVVNIFYGRSTATGWKFYSTALLDSFYFLEYEKTPRMTEIDFISNVGGLLGLFMGFSLISLFEIIYWFIIKTFKHCAA